MRHSRLMVAFTVLVASLVAVYAQAQYTPGRTLSGAGTFYGQVRAVGSGTVGTWATVDRRGRPQAIGFAISRGAFSNLPAGYTEYVFALPPQARLTPFTHLTLDWNPHGHIPPQVYDVPHFDFHFYIISPETRSRITATGEDLAVVERVPEARFVPQGYVSTPGGESHMGAHWINPASPEFHGQPFTQTFIYGFYNGQMAFLEPMATIAYLQSQPSMEQAIPQPAAYPTRGYYPTRYSIRYDAAAQLTHITLIGFVRR